MTRKDRQDDHLLTPAADVDKNYQKDSNQMEYCKGT